MFRHLPKRFIAVGLLLGSASVASSGCSDNTSMVFIRGIAALQDSCVVTADSSSLFLLGGTLDTRLRQRYDAALIVGNQLVRRGNRLKLQVETSRVTLRGAVVEIYETDGTLVRDFTVDATGFVDPATGEEPSYGVVAVTLIPSLQGIKAGKTYRVNVRVFGDTLGGEALESSTLVFPVSTCDGCLISFPVQAWDPLTAPTQYTCNDTTTPATSEPCRLGQDEAVDCRYCAAFIDACKAPS